MSLSDLIGHPVRLVVLDDDQDFVDALGAALYGSRDAVLLNYAARAADAEEAIRTQAPDAVLVDHGLPRENGLLVAERFAKAFPSVMVFLLTDSPTRELWREAVARGLRGTVRRPAAHDRATMAAWVQEHLVTVLREAIDAERRQEARLESPAGVGKTTAGAVRAATPRVIAVWSPKGGVGKTTVAVNLALWAQANPASRIPTALVDLEEGSGGTNALLNMPAYPTLLDWLDHADADEVDPAAVERRVAVHQTQLHCVFQPESLMDSARVDGRLVRVVIRSLRATHGLVVLDCAPSPTEPVRVALEAASAVVMVVEPVFQALKKVVSTFADLRKEGFDVTKFRVLVNRMPKNPTINESEIAGLFAEYCPVIGSIPEDPDVPRAANQRRPLALYHQNGPFMTALKKAAAKLVPGLDAAATARQPGAGFRLRLPFIGR